MPDNSRHFDGTLANIISLTNPSGITLDAAFTLGCWMYVHSFGANGRVAIRVGPAGGDLGIAFGTREVGGGNPRVLRVRTDGLNNDGTTQLTADTWYGVGCTHDGVGNDWFRLIVSGVEEFVTRRTIANLSAGDVFRLADAEANTFRDPIDGRIAWGFWLQGVTLSAAAINSYLNNPQALVTDYGPTGVVVANALKLLWPCQCNNATEVDKSGVGNDGIYTGTTLGAADGPSPSTPWNPCSVAKSAAVTGTGAAGVTGAQVRAGAKTLITTLTGDTFSATDLTAKQAIVDSWVAGTSPTWGWNAVRASINAATAVVFTGNTVATLTLPALPNFQSDTTLTLTQTIPGAILTGGAPIVATPTVAIARTVTDLTPVGNYAMTGTATRT